MSIRFPPTVIKITGLEQLQENLKLLPQRVQNTVVRDALEAGGAVIAFAARMGAYRILRMAESWGYKRKKGKHLYETIGTRAKMYRQGVTSFLAVGPLYKEGGYHGHLIEFGHRIVRGGTLSKPGIMPGITARGKRQLKTLGVVYKRRRWQTISGKVIGKKMGMKYRGFAIRGGGIAGGMTKPRRFMAPAFDSRKYQALDKITAMMEKGIAREAAKLRT